MATTVADPVFVDKNTLIYAGLTQSQFHSIAKLQDLAAACHPLWISRQILREYLAAMSRPGTLTIPIPMTTLVSDVRSFEKRFLLAEDGPSITSHRLNLLVGIPCAGSQVYDANIVAIMLAHGIPRLLTHNVADFSRFAAHITIIPLVP
jgi:predicted nucleic acid-binding protein